MWRRVGREGTMTCLQGDFETGGLIGPCGAEAMVICFSPAATVALCIEHAKRYGLTVAWLEEHNRPLRDHVTDAYNRSMEKEHARNVAALMKETT